MAADDKDKNTIVVKGLSFALDDKQIEEFFSDLGPVKKCFTVKKKGQERHNGTAFITFSIPEDAERALGELNGSAVLGGRKIQVGAICHVFPTASTMNSGLRCCCGHNIKRMR